MNLEFNEYYEINKHKNGETMNCIWDRHKYLKIYLNTFCLHSHTIH